ncbi:recombinase RecT [Paracoccus sp. (in: a-proteobacteria)]|uniref:recombinase RecT n=1 Tax=Paracoccus sp. TaxID=267 RepID=UPI0028AD971E|nr:recombinase RecT [Paracoccus sp. (in: a-proteobacteria)]
MNAPATTLPAAKRPLKQVQSVKELLVNDQAKQQLAAVAAGHMRPERMLRLMANAMRTTPQLGDCEPLSLLGSMMTCASLGVEPNTPLGHAYLIPFKNKRKGITEVQLILGYKGMIDLARRSGHIRNIHGDVVYEGDEFSFEYGSEQHLKHRPKGKRVNPIYAYCHATLTDGEAFVVLPWDEVMAIRDASQGYRTAIQYGKKDSPWIAHQHEMAAKTAVRALFKYLPISIELDGGKLGDALTVDENQIDFSSFAINPEDGPAIDGEIVDEETGEVHQVEDQRHAQQTIPDEREKATPVARRKQTPRTDSTPYAEGGPQAGRQAALDMGGAAETKAEPVPEGFDRFIEHVDALISDEMNDGMPLAEIKDLHGSQLAQIAQHAPERHAQMMKSYEDFAANH